VYLVQVWEVFDGGYDVVVGYVAYECYAVLGDDLGGVFEFLVVLVDWWVVLCCFWFGDGVYDWCQVYVYVGVAQFVGSGVGG